MTSNGVRERLIRLLDSLSSSSSSWSKIKKKMKLILDSLFLSRSISPILFFLPSFFFELVDDQPPTPTDRLFSPTPLFFAGWIDLAGTLRGSDRREFLSYLFKIIIIVVKKKGKRKKREREHSLCLYAAEAAEYIYAICRAIHTHTSQDYNIYMASLIPAG